MRQLAWWIAPLFILTACLSTADAPEAAEEMTRPPPGSNEMLRANLTHDPHLEVIISDVVIPAGATVPSHFHPGEEFVYVIEGSAVHVEDGKPDQILSAGDSYVIPPDAIHAPRGGPDGARAIVFRVHRNGLPERINMGAQGPIPDVSDLSLRVSAEEISALQTQVSANPDASCIPMARRAVMCRVSESRQIYVFTEISDPAHPSALYRGFETADDGSTKLIERGWSAADPDEAARFYASLSFWPDTAVAPNAPPAELHPHPDHHHKGHAPE